MLTSNKKSEKPKKAQNPITKKPHSSAFKKRVFLNPA